MCDKSSWSRLRHNLSVVVFRLCGPLVRAGLLVTQSRRDGDLNDGDSIQIVFDTFNDQQNGFLFGTNPIGIE